MTAAVIFSGSAGWGSPLTLGLLAAGILAGAAFWVAEHRIREPMLPPAFFAHRLRTAAVTSAALMGFLKFVGAVSLCCDPSRSGEAVMGFAGSMGCGLKGPAA